MVRSFLRQCHLTSSNCDFLSGASIFSDCTVSPALSLVESELRTPTGPLAGLATVARSLDTNKLAVLLYSN